MLIFHSSLWEKIVSNSLPLKSMGLVGTAEGPISWQQQKNQKLSIINVSTGKYATGAKILKLKKRRIRFFLYTKYSTSFLETSLRRSEK